MTIDLVSWLVTSSLLLSGWALYNVLRSRQWIALIREELAALRPPEDAGTTSAAHPEPPTLECVIRLKDPIKVAESENPMAKTVTGIAPNLIIREVYRQVRLESIALLEKREIEADVLVRVR